MTQITLQYFDGCPNWKTTDTYLRDLIANRGIGTEVVYEKVESPEAAERLRFRGSPTVLVDGQDPFADGDAPVGLSCRIYATENGLAGSPTLAQLEEALTSQTG